jgi:dTDP-4-dehydrorhamnose reductase
MKQVLIFGTKGTLGQTLVTCLDKSEEYNAIALDKEECDITDEKAVHKIFSQYAPDIVINAAALNAVDDIETDDSLFERALQINGFAPGIIAQACKELDIIFVHYSTDYVFDGTDTDGYKEDVVPNPLSRYAETKLKGEEEVVKVGGMYYVIRISRLFGSTGSGEGSKLSFVDLMLHLAKTKDHLDIVSDQISSPSCALDVADFTMRLIEDHFSYGIYHGANSGSCSWYEWAQKIFEMKNISINLAKVPATHFSRPAKAPMHSVLLNTKGPKQRSWKDALDEYIASK